MSASNEEESAQSRPIVNRQAILEQRFAEQDEIAAQRARRFEAAAFCWPVLMALVTLSVLVLQRFGWLPHPLRRYTVFLLVINPLLAVVGSIVAGVYAARYHQRTAAAIVFGVASFFICITVFAVLGFFLQIAGIRI